MNAPMHKKRIQIVLEIFKKYFPEGTNEDFEKILRRLNHYKLGDVKNITAKENAFLKELSQKIPLHISTLVYSMNKFVKKSIYSKEYGVKRETKLFSKAILLKKIISTFFPENSAQDFMRMLYRCRRFYYQECKELSAEEHILLDILLKEKINPSTALKYFKLSLFPEEVHDKINSGQINIEQANIIMRNHSQRKNAVLALQILEESRAIIREVL